MVFPSLKSQYIKIDTHIPRWVTQKGYLHSINIICFSTNPQIAELKISMKWAVFWNSSIIHLPLLPVLIVFSYLLGKSFPKAFPNSIPMCWSPYQGLLSKEPNLHPWQKPSLKADVMWDWKSATSRAAGQDEAALWNGEGCDCMSEQERAWLAPWGCIEVPIGISLPKWNKWTNIASCLRMGRWVTLWTHPKPGRPVKMGSKWKRWDVDGIQRYLGWRTNNQLWEMGCQEVTLRFWLNI